MLGRARVDPGARQRQGAPPRRRPRPLRGGGLRGRRVTDIARDAGATTGALYHHFGSKAGLFATLREEMERRVRDRMEGAFAAVGGGRAGLAAALRSGSTPPCASRPSASSATRRARRARRPAADAALLLGTYRAALAAVAGGVPASEARSALAWTLGAPPDTTGRRDR
jgi:AcrR family transcriptional regulator